MHCHPAKTWMFLLKKKEIDILQIQLHLTGERFHLTTAEDQAACVST